MWTRFLAWMVHERPTTAPAALRYIGEYDWRGITWAEFVWSVDLCPWDGGRQDTTVSPLRHCWSPWCTEEVPDGVEGNSRLAGSRLSGTAGSASHGVAPCPAFAYTRTNGNVQVEKEQSLSTFSVGSHPLDGKQASDMKMDGSSCCFSLWHHAAGQLS